MTRGEPSTAMDSQASKRILITTMGTRGDVQPFVALGLGLKDRGWQVSISAPAEFKGFVESHGIQHLDGGRSLQREVLESAEGKALRTAGTFSMLQATKSFFSVKLLESWFQATSENCTSLQPDVLLLTSFPALSGASIIPKLLGLGRTRVVVAHTVPMAPTVEFGVPLSGKGFSARWPLLNRLQWAASSKLVGRGIHAKTAKRVVERAVEELQAQYQRLVPGKASLEVGPQFGLASVPNLYIYSPALLPKPADWPDNCHVVGPLLLSQHHQQLAAAAAEAGKKEGAIPAGVQGGCSAGSGRMPARESDPGASSEGCSNSNSSGNGSGSSGPASLGAGSSLHGQGSPDPGESSSEGPSPMDSPCHPPPSADSSADSASFVILASRDGTSRLALPAHDPRGCYLATQQPGPPDVPHSEPSIECGTGTSTSTAMITSTDSALAGGGKTVLKGESKEELQCALPPGALGLPAALQAYLDEAFRAQLPVVYIGLGSMLGTVFDPEQVSHVLDCIAQGVMLLSERRPLRAVIHTALGGGKSAQLAEGVPAGAPFMLLDQPVIHNLLLPQVSLVVHHGGAGTTHAALAAGKPALVVPCVPSSDQSFWGDLVWRRGLGPQWFHVSKLTPTRLAQGLEEGLGRLEELTLNAERMAVALHQEDGVGTAIDIIEATAAGL